ncbi:histidine phosphatase family protein [Phenylobacterium sp.]|jgi:probable phosphoglycerate mutase|uniref:histidine phosphatase family protein n=1 Tax=Phenylobacterium sp. TaxID=1871053 RepID=UPI002F920114
MILLVRHGETEWNVVRRLQGRSDSPLTERGRRQVRAMGRLIRDLIAHDGGEGWRLISSPLGRTVATAEAIAAATGLAVEYDERVAEVNCGEWEGALFTDILTGAGGTMSRGRIFEAPGGETLADVQARIASFLADLPPEPDRRVVLVSHGVTGRVLRGQYAGVPDEQAVELDAPHDAVWRLADGQLDRFDCEPLNDLP